MFKFIIKLLLLLSLLACTDRDQSILVKDGDELLNCKELEAELDFAHNLDENARARRRQIKKLQREKKCLNYPQINISIGISKNFD